ncbi:MAG: hypothetical protein AMJ79_04025 [Phycisphaerae bacterium SM23_30]|nr:MAG: hypothetical protein AMJ79_04025 [Phycisphaerae bacterium SM23_30]
MKQVNFLPEDYMDKKAQRRTNIVCLGLFVVVMAGVGGGFVMTERRQRLVDERLSQINKDMRQASQSLQQLKLLEAKREEMMKKASISASLMEPVPRSLLLATVTNDLPVGVSLTEFELKSKDVSQDSDNLTPQARRVRNKKSQLSNNKAPTTDQELFTPKKWETTIEITGLAPTDIQVAQFIAQLHKSKLFQEVNLLYSEEHEVEEEIIRQFKLMVILDPEVRASEEEVAEARKKFVTGIY